MNITAIQEQDLLKILGKLDEIHKDVTKPKTSSENLWINGDEVRAILKISARCLQTYRSEGLIGFSQIGKKVILYKRTEVEQLLNKNCYVCALIKLKNI